MFYGDSLLGWAFRIALAVLAFFLVLWLLPAFFGLLSIAVPHQIVVIIALIVALAVLLSRQWLPAARR